MNEILCVKGPETLMQTLRVTARQNLTNVSSIVRQGLYRDLQRRGLTDYDVAPTT